MQDRVMQQALHLYKKWMRKHDTDKLHTECVDDLLLDMYRTEYKRDVLLDDALTELIELKRSEHRPVDHQAVALANLRYVDAI